MLTREEVQRLCDGDLSGHLRTLAVERVTMRSARIRLWIAVILAIPVGLALARLGLSLEAVALAVIVVVVPPVYVFSKQSHEAESRRATAFADLVENVAARILRGASFGQEPGGPSIWAAVDASGIFSKVVEECETITRLSGVPSPEGFVFAEVRLFRVTGRPSHLTNSEEEDRRKEINLFRGLFIAFDRSTMVRGTTFVDPKRVGVSIATRDSVDPVSLDDPEFERVYRVAASDPGEARALLSPSARAGLLRLKELAGRPVHLSTAFNRVSIAVEFGQPLFALDSRAVDVNRVAELANLFGLAEAAVALPLGATRPGRDRQATAATSSESGSARASAPGRPATSTARLKRETGGLSIVYLRTLSWLALAVTGLSAPLLGWFWFLAGREALTPSGDVTGAFVLMIPLSLATVLWFFWAQVWWDPVRRVDVKAGELTVARGLLRRTRLAAVPGQRLAIRKGVLRVNEFPISPRLPYDELQWLGYELSCAIPSLGRPE